MSILQFSELNDWLSNEIPEYTMPIFLVTVATKTVAGMN